jgi:hypothetical protein
MSGIGIGNGCGLSALRTVLASAGSNPNLLVFPEAFDNAAWTKTLTTVTANPGDATHPTADRMAMSGGGGMVLQSSATAATTGASANFSFSLAGIWERQSVTGTFNGLPYTFSLEFLGLGGEDILMQIARVGGVLQVSITDSSSLNPAFLAYGAKLEQAASFSGYP